MKRALAGLLAAGVLAGGAAAPGAASAALPPDLGYELVSPLASRGFDFTRAWLFHDGDRAVIGSEISDVNGVFPAERTAGGWQTGYRALTSPIASPLIASGTVAVSDDLSRIVTIGAKTGSVTWDRLALSEPGGRWKAIGGPLQYVDGSPDARRLIVALAPNADPAELFPDVPGQRTGVFLWRDDDSDAGAVTAIGADAERLTTCGGQAPDDSGRRMGQSGVSPDARTVVVSSRPDCVDPDSFDPIPRHVYVWREGVGTTDVTAPPSGPDGPATFVGSTADLGAVFVRTALALDPADANGADDVYRYDVAAGTHTRVTGTATDGGETLTSAASSDDGSHVWFATADGDGRPALWVATRGAATRLVKRVGEADGFVDAAFWLDASENAVTVHLPTQLTPDGTTIAWTTRMAIDGVGGSGSGDANDSGQIFRATADGAFGCVTCAADGALTSYADYGEPLQGLQTARRAISDDGRRIYFQTPTALDAGDRNELGDVYGWHDGELSLISAGDEAHGAAVAGVSGRGDVLFKTHAQLLPWIDDDHLKVYVARIGGGLPGPVDPREGCSGDGCQGGPAARTPQPGNASDGPGGPADADDRPPLFAADPSMRVGKLSAAAAAERALARGRAVTLTVRSNTAGRVTATTRWKAGRRWRTAGARTRSVKAGGSVRLTLRLSRAARAQLARRGALRIRIDVVHGQVAKPRRLAFVLKPAHETPARKGAHA